MTASASPSHPIPRLAATTPTPTPTSDGVPDPAVLLAAAARLAASDQAGALPRFARELDALVPGPPDRLLAVLTGDCSRAPLKLHGDAGSSAAVTSAELARLAGIVAVGEPWTGTATLADAERPVLAVAAAAEGSAGTLLAIDLTGTTLAPGAERIVQGLWEVQSATQAARASEPEPSRLVESLAAAQERARTIVELGEAHEAALTAVLAALRSRGADDRTARAAATDVAVSALIELRQAGDRDRALSEEPADAAFDRLREHLRPLARYASAELELAGPDDQRALPAELAHAARAISRGIALVLLEQDGVGRIRIGWRVADDELTIGARDDGDGALTEAALAVHRTLERVRALDGRLALESVPDWGTTVTVGLPLAAVVAAPPNPLTSLNPREREVLAELVRGARNRQIGETLAITPHTVKFHVTNILRKLGVESRGEAAAIAREHGLPASSGSAAAG